MEQNAVRPTVFLRSCPDYDTAAVRGMVRQALQHLGLRPYGKTLVKPNVVSSGDQFPHAYTRPEFLEGVLLGLKDEARADLEELAIGERCGITIPTRYAYKHADYYPMARRVGAKMYHFDEVSQVPIQLTHPGRLRDEIFTPAPVAAADFFVNCPKFKAHPWTTVTFSLKNYIGIQDDRHRLIDHHHRLNEKVADLQYIVQPQFIAIDAITAGEGRMLTPMPFDLGMVIMGNNQVAFDTVCCHIIGIDPMSVEHIRLAHERGFGPVDLDEIDIRGDVTLAEAKQRASGFRSGLIRVEDYFEGTNISAYGGRPPSDGTADYCWGGCPGALEEAIEIIRQFDSRTDERMPKTHIVFGRRDEPLDIKPGEKVIFMGDCASYTGPLGDKQVEVTSLYRDRSGDDPRLAKEKDVFVAMAQMGAKMRRLKRDEFIHIAGCPVSVAEQLLALIALGKLRSPFYDPKTAPSFVSCYLSARTRQVAHRLFGQPYNVKALEQRGDAKALPPGVPNL